MAQTNARIHSWQDADAYLGSKQERPLANNTRIRRRDDNAIVIRLHNTDIVTYFPREAVNPPVTVLHTGGWLTSTTKERINAFLPEGFRVSQERGQWTLHAGGWESGKDYPWAEGITIDTEGSVYNAGDLSDVEAGRLLQKQIRKYVRAYVAALLAGEIPAPSGADCWLCAGLAPEGKDHILSHFEESYFVPSLLLRAIESYQICILARGRLGEIWGYVPAPEGAHKWADDILARDVTSSLTRYLKHILAIAR